MCRSGAKKLKKTDTCTVIDVQRRTDRRRLKRTMDDILVKRDLSLFFLFFFYLRTVSYCCVFDTWPGLHGGHGLFEGLGPVDLTSLDRYGRASLRILFDRHSRTGLRIHVPFVLGIRYCRTAVAFKYDLIIPSWSAVTWYERSTVRCGSIIRPPCPDRHHKVVYIYSPVCINYIGMDG